MRLNDIEINVGQLVIALILFTGILPITYVLGFEFPLQYLYLPIFTLIFLRIVLRNSPIPSVAKNFILMWILILVEVLFSSIFSPLYSHGTFNAPTEIAPYIARMLFFIFFIFIFYRYDIKLNKFMYSFIIVLILGMFVGVLQFFDWPGSDIFRKLYTFNERHYSVMNRAIASSRRISGVGHMATATGGIAVFTSVIILSVFMFFKKHRLITAIGLALVIFNIVTAQSRMGYLTLGFSLIIFYFIYIFVYQKRFIKPTFILISISTIIVSFLTWLYQTGNTFVVRAVYRWEALGEQISEGENRVGQIGVAFNQLNNPFEYLFGISRGGQELAGNLHMEVEPINIIMLYGWVGFFLQYGLVLMLLIYFFRNIKFVRKHPILLAMTVASFIGLLSYQFFSMAYFFFREIRIGLFPWILMGATIGALERFKSNSRNVEPEKISTIPKKKKRIRITW